MKDKKDKLRSGLLKGARIYLSGPMDFVASRAAEKKYGWRNRVGQFLRSYGVTVFDPWNKPEVRGLYEYGREDEQTTNIRNNWRFEYTDEGAKARACCSEAFWETIHIDLRMVDTSDFTIAYCPTNIYSVGTVHEIVLCRRQQKPVLFVSPMIEFDTLHRLKEHLEDKDDKKAGKLLDQLEKEIPIKENPRGTPSLWYMYLVGNETFFDGFGFTDYRKRFGWDKAIPLDAREEKQELKRPLLPFLEKLNGELPQKWDNIREIRIPNDDFLFWDLKRKKGGGAEISQVKDDPSKMDVTMMD